MYILKKKTKLFTYICNNLFVMMRVDDDNKPIGYDYTKDNLIILQSLII